MIKKFIQKPISPARIEAIQYDDTVANFHEIRVWVGKSFFYDRVGRLGVFLESHCLTHHWPVVKGDWIVKTEEGYFEVYKQIHMEKFEEV